MPCDSVLTVQVELTGVDHALLSRVAAAEGAEVQRFGRLELRQRGTLIQIDRGGVLTVTGQPSVMWQGKRYDVQSEAGKASLVAAMRQSVSVAAVAQAVGQVGGRVVAAGGTSARVHLRDGQSFGVEVLPDGRIKAVTDVINGPAHLQAEQFFQFVQGLVGGTFDRVRRNARAPHVHVDASGARVEHSHE